MYNETRIGCFQIRCKEYSDTTKCIDLLRNAIIIANVNKLIATNVYNNQCCIYIDIVSQDSGFFTHEQILTIKDNILSITKDILLDNCSFIEKDTNIYISLAKINRPIVIVNKGILRGIIYYILSFWY